MSRSPRGSHERILIVDTDTAFRESLVRHLRTSGFEVVTAATGESAFSLLRDWHSPIGWLYTRADLTSLIDGWILADEYHDSHPQRAAVIAASRERVSAQGHVVLSQPSLAAALDALLAVASAKVVEARPATTNTDPQRFAA
jgi:ActR/RegA family two-component response regulator